jgi:hypothetical protein
MMGKRNVSQKMKIRLWFKLGWASQGMSNGWILQICTFLQWNGQGLWISDPNKRLAF